MYTSPLFKAGLRSARALKPDLILILSAKYGVLPLERHIAPYDLTLTKMRAPQRKAWAQRVMKQLRRATDPERDRFVVLAGKYYVQDLQLANKLEPLEHTPLAKRCPFLLSELRRVGT